MVHVATILDWLEFKDVSSIHPASSVISQIPESCPLVCYAVGHRKLLLQGRSKIISLSFIKYHIYIETFSQICKIKGKRSSLWDLQIKAHIEQQKSHYEKALWWYIQLYVMCVMMWSQRVKGWVHTFSCLYKNKNQVPCMNIRAGFSCCNHFSCSYGHLKDPLNVLPVKVMQNRIHSSWFVQINAFRS